MVRQNWWNKRYDRYYVGLKQEIKDKIRQAYRDLDLHSGGRTQEHYEILLDYIGDYYILGESLTEKNERINKNYEIISNQKQS
jgi:hypothetical protein